MKCKMIIEKLNLIREVGFFISKYGVLFDALEIKKDDDIEIHWNENLHVCLYDEALIQSIKIDEKKIREQLESYLHLMQDDVKLAYCKHSKKIKELTF